MGLRVLITNIELDAPCGTTMYVRDLALELQRTGHEPIVYTSRAGAVAEELAEEGIAVTSHLRHIRAAPDVIHGHHSIPTLTALRRFPEVPAIYVCHDHTGYLDRAVIDPQIRQYFGVSQLCIERLIRDGVAPEKVRLLHNFVDTRRFVARGRLPAQPRSALVFSNYAHECTHLPAIAEACRQAGLELNVIGKSVGNCIARPESILGRYDIVFAKAKAAMEAMASGAAVVLCDVGGVGPAVTSDNFDPLRPMNFGLQALDGPLTAQSVLRQIRRYDPEDAARVCAKLRSSATLEDAAKNLCEIYKEVISCARISATVARRGRGQGTAVQPLEALRTDMHILWLKLSPAARMLLRRLPGVSALLLKLRICDFESR